MTTDSISEALGEKLFALSDSIREHGLLDDPKAAARYEAVVSAFEAMSRASQPVEPTFDSEAVERVARAMFEEQHRGLKNCHAWDDNWEHDEHWRDTLMRMSRAALLSLAKPVGGE